MMMMMMMEVMMAMKKMMMMMEVMMAMKKMMMAVRLMVDFGPFLEDSATRKCGLKDHAVHFETLS